MIPRQPRTRTRRAELALRLKPLVAAQARERMLSGKPQDPVPNLAQGKARDELAAAAGVSHDTIAKMASSHGADSRGSPGTAAGARLRRAESTNAAGADPEHVRADDALHDAESRRQFAEDLGFDDVIDRKHTDAEGLGYSGDPSEIPF